MQCSLLKNKCLCGGIVVCVNTILLFSANEVALGVTTINSKLEVRALFPSHLLPLQTLQILHLTPKATLTQNWLKTIFLANRQGTKRWQKQQIQQQLWSLNTIRYVSNGFGGFSWGFFFLWKKIIQQSFELQICTWFWIVCNKVTQDTHCSFTVACLICTLGSDLKGTL